MSECRSRFDGRPSTGIHLPALLVAACLSCQVEVADAAIVIDSIVLQNHASYSVNQALVPNGPSLTDSNAFTVPAPFINDTVSVTYNPPPEFDFVFAVATSSINASLTSTSISLEASAFADANATYASSFAFFDLEVLFSVTNASTFTLSGSAGSSPRTSVSAVLSDSDNVLFANASPFFLQGASVILSPNEQYTLRLGLIVAFAEGSGRISITAVPEVSSIVTAAISFVGFLGLAVTRLRLLTGKRENAADEQESQRQSVTEL